MGRNPRRLRRPWAVCEVTSGGGVREELVAAVSSDSGEEPAASLAAWWNRRVAAARWREIKKEWREMRMTGGSPH
jgi:hypothetical protein